MDTLVCHHEPGSAGLRALSARNPIVSELQLLCRDEIALIEQRTALVNQLKQALHEYYPAALEAIDDWVSPAAWTFVLTFPTPVQLQPAGRRKWEKFLHANRLWRQETAEKRMGIFARATAFSGTAPMVAAKSLLAVSLARMLRTLAHRGRLCPASRPRAIRFVNGRRLQAGAAAAGRTGNSGKPARLTTRPCTLATKLNMAPGS